MFQQRSRLYLRCISSICVFCSPDPQIHVRQPPLRFHPPLAALQYRLLVPRRKSLCCSSSKLFSLARLSILDSLRPGKPRLKCHKSSQVLAVGHVLSLQRRQL